MGLVQYDSSDEDEDAQVEQTATVKTTLHLEMVCYKHTADSKPQPSASSSKDTEPQIKDAPRKPIRKPHTHHQVTNRLTEPQPPTETTPSLQPPTQPQSAPEAPSLGPVLGPVLGPALDPQPPPSAAANPSPTAQTTLDPSEVDDMAFLNDPTPDPPRSPYSASRALARDLTLPAVPDMDIPPSPPPSQHADMTSLNAKFDNFLKLKRRAIDPAHFNARLGASSSIRNPATMDKFLNFVGMETEFAEGDGAATAQYVTTVGTDVWDPSGLPEWAYRGALRRAQAEVTKERERARGEPVEFVTTGAGAGVEGGAGAVPVRGQRRTMFDT